MKKLLFPSALILVLAFSSCNNQAKKEAALNDLTACQQKLNLFQQNIEQLKITVKSSTVEIVLAKDALSGAKEFHWLRTDEERTKDIRNAAINIQKIADVIDSSNNVILALNDSIANTNIQIQNIKEFLKN